MKNYIILIIILFTAAMSRADLVIQQRGIGMGATNNVTVSIQGNMMREDGGGDVIGHIVQIIDMSTLDQTMLVVKNKTFSKTSGTKIQEFLKNQEDQTEDTNILVITKPTSTGKSEKFQNFETDIYFWTNGKNVTNRLWVAKNYPNFENIKPYLIKLDEFHKRGIGKDLEGPVSELPGMVVKKEEIIEGQKGVIELIDAKVQSVDASLFTIPNDYTEMKQNN